MSDTKPAEVILMSEKIGLPANASAEAITARVYEMQEKLERAEKFLAEQEHLLLRAEDGEKAKAKLKEVEAKHFIDRAIANQWIDKKDEAFYVAMYAEHPEKVKDHIESQKYRGFMARAQALRDAGTNPKNAVEEVTMRVAALRSENKSLTESAAQTLVFTENPKLYDAYRAAVSANGGAN